mgnify:CR=1 FL=1
MSEFYNDNNKVMNSSLFSSKTSKEYGEAYRKNTFADTNLKQGIVIKVYEIDDKLNKTKKFPEYDVLVVEQKQNSTQEPIIYKHCIAIDKFGGIADYFEFKVRAVDGRKEDSKAPLDIDFENQFGNMVLVLCQDGSTDKGVIVNSVPHPGRKTKLDKDAGVHLEGEYNGLNWQINKDGEFTITFKSKTNVKGEPQDETAGGTHLKIDKKGSVDINANLEGDEETYIRMDKENKDLGLKAGANIGFTAKKDVAITADGGISGKAKGSVSFEAEGTAKVAAKSSLTLEGKSEVTIKGGNLTADVGKIFTLAAETFLGGKVYVGDGGAPAVIGTTKFIGQGNHGAPVVCSAVGPFSSSVFIAP